VHRVLVDEDLPRSLARFLSSAGIDAVDVRDAGLRSASDDAIFARCQAERRTLLTGGLGFANVLRFPLGGHFGIVVARYPDAVSTQSLNEALVRALERVPDTEIVGALVIVEPGRTRMLRRAARG